MHRTKRTLAVAAVAATTAIAGCGSDGDDTATATPAAVASTPATTATTATTPSDQPQSVDPNAVDPELASWAKKFCGALAGQSKPITPPSVAPSSPDSTQNSLATFFEQVVDQQAGQIKAIESAGPPPGSKAKKAWEKSNEKLRAVRKSVAKVVRNIKKQDPKKASDVQSLVSQLGTQMKDLSSYQGPIAELSTNKTLGPALQAETSCTTAG